MRRGFDVSMNEIGRFSGRSEAIELAFVEGEATPTELMELAIHLHLGGLSLADTVAVLGRFGVSRARSTVHNWVHKADLEPKSRRDPAKVALDERFVKVNGEQFLLVAAVKPDTNVILHIRLYPSRNTALTKIFLREIKEKHVIDDAEFLVDGAP
jgi:putative transposase